MGELARKIHSITPEDLNNTKLFGLKADWKKMYEKEFAFYLGEALKNKYLSTEIEKEIKITFKIFQDKILESDIEPRLTHGDFSPSNIQVGNKKIVGIFDFEWSKIADPLWDLQKLPINFQLGNEFNKTSFLQGYGLNQFTEKGKIRFKIYCFHQGMWEIWATKTKLFPFGEKEIREGYDLINLAITFF